MSNVKIENNYLNLYARAEEYVKLNINDHIIIVGPPGGLK